MPVEKTMSWRTSDKALHENEDAAREHEFSVGLRQWWSAAFEKMPGDVGGNPLEYALGVIIKERMKLLSIFRELGAPSAIDNITAPVTPSPPPIPPQSGPRAVKG